MMYATSLLEPFPTVSTLSKLIYCDTLILADNIHYNKRNKPNKIQIINDQYLSLEVTNKGKLSELNILNRDLFNRKLLRNLTDTFQSAPYYTFFFEEIKKILDTSNTYYELSTAVLNWIIKTFKLSTVLKFSSEISQEFDIVSISEYMERTYFVEEAYRSYLHKLNIKDVRYFSTTMRSPENYHKAISENTSFFEFIFEWGPYFPRLFKID